MRYPGKFWRNLSYSCVDGRLREELGMAGRPGWKHRRRWRIAVRRDDDYGVAVLDGAGAAHVDGWEDTVDHRLSSVTLRFDGRDGGVVWVRTAIAPFRFFCSPPDSLPDERGPIDVAARSGPMVATWAEVDGRSVEVLQPVGGAIDASQLRLVPLCSVVPAGAA